MSVQLDGAVLILPEAGTKLDFELLPHSLWEYYATEGIAQRVLFLRNKKPITDTVDC